MFGQLNIYKNLIIGGVVVFVVLVIYLYTNNLKSQIMDLQSNLKDCHVEFANEKLQSERYKNKLDKQNLIIEANKVNEEKSKAELAKWKLKPAIIKYKYKEVYSNDCKDIKNSINDIRHLEFRSM